VAVTSPTASISSTSYWGEDADNWGADSEEEDSVPSVDQENGNVIIKKPRNEFFYYLFIGR